MVVGDSDGFRQRIDDRAAVVLDQAQGLAVRFREVHCCCLDGGDGLGGDGDTNRHPHRLQPPVQSSQLDALATLASFATAKTHREPASARFLPE